MGSVHKAFQVLHAFRDAGGPLSLGEIAAATGLDKSAAQRFSHSLWKLGYLEKDTRTRRYRLGHRVLELTFSYLQGNRLVEAAMPMLAELRRSTGQRVSLSLWEDVSLIYVIRQQSQREYFWASLIGRRVPLFCTAGGRAILAQLPRAEAEDILARSPLRPLTPQTLTDPAAIMARVEQARQDGYGAAAEEVEQGERVLGAAVQRADGRPVGAVHLAAPLGEWDREEFGRRFAPLLLEVTRGLRSAAG
ncbi:IclR family transcriptional regulator [Teichococcus deserti]|uniref:IclR family transcriptional regulator n=1 Tax=Teichococcus deserti TaxID=1817963 RepID=UPI001F60AE31|nr:IclR family transcriptional regulator [Pseudoroseomonas deserti]